MFSPLTKEELLRLKANFERFIETAADPETIEIFRTELEIVNEKLARL